MGKGPSPQLLIFLSFERNYTSGGVLLETIKP